ncbi:L-serine dehydratase, iron-sulfur-dependent subunit beta [Paenibacillus marchantiophytorum]|uniref:L-serine deaminase n=1 Tax=Paenibacillus marchantiophytorum TaxID=1619310 RepID=A0ABQ1F5N1_9BACL|nr:L-serine ammonia-lyase, iron-sulfur-dependent subunit beta [Paenibacillus marchantiophytorum]GGA00052.1 L-serine dehydratase, iron-sulfur-dependent subunit beta [Paenibacillus marchantiophytorum]
MRFKDVFSIIGPDMIGPSSSHTAGAVRIGLAARQLFGRLPERAELYLYGSFAETYRGHGTDVALAAGLLGWGTDNERIPEALEAAKEQGVELLLIPSQGIVGHPNTVRICLKAEGFSDLTVLGTSIGGGNIEIVGIDDFDVRFSASFPTMVITHTDQIGMLAEITGCFRQSGVNIGSMDVDRRSRSGEVLTVIEADSEFPDELVRAVSAIDAVRSLRLLVLS